MKRDKLSIDEKSRFLKYFSCSTDKLDTPKNRDKPHWLDQSLFELKTKIREEDYELEIAIGECFDSINTNYEDIFNELKDRINTALLTWDKLIQMREEYDGD